MLTEHNRPVNIKIASWLFFVAGFVAVAGKDPGEACRCPFNRASIAFDPCQHETALQGIGAKQGERLCVLHRMSVFDQPLLQNTLTSIEGLPSSLGDGPVLRCEF